MAPPPTPWAKGESGNPGGQPQGKGFRKWLRGYFENPETRQLLLDKITRDLKGDGAATFALKALAYVYGEPKQTLELVAVTEITRLAADAGVSPDELLAEVDRLSLGTMN